MLKLILDWSLGHRRMVLLLSVTLMAAGLYVARNMDLDVFPDLTAPTVVVLTEAHGLSAEEVEQLVTFPIESALNGTPSLRRIRSSSSQGFSTIWVEFDWSTDVYLARQVVNERLVAVQSRLPMDVDAPMLAPIASIMGEVMLLTVQSSSRPMSEVRSMSDWQLRPRLMAVEGVANVSVLGGSVTRLQVEVDPGRLQHHGVSLEQVTEASRQAANGAAGGGVFNEYGNQYSVRVAGRVRQPADVADAPIPGCDGLRIRDVADVNWGEGDPLGAGACNGEEAVVLTVAKQPGVNTLDLTGRLDDVLADWSSTLPADIRIRSDVFRQADFIEASIDNLSRTLWEGAFFVALVLFLFLMNWRTTVISVLAIPLSLLSSVLVLNALGLDFNTMSLGGMAIAIGALVDDAIIDVENVFKRWRERQGEPLLTIIREASLEIRSSIVVATFIILVSFVPLFFLSGMEGRLLLPLGVAFMTSVLSSLLVAVTVTPVLCSYLLGGGTPHREGGTRLEGIMKRAYTRSLRAVLKRSRILVAAAGALVVGAVVLFLNLGSAFLPPFNEGSLVISLVGPPGMSLEETNRMGTMAEELLLAMPEIDVVTRRSGRAELDEHAQGVNSSEVDAPFHLAEGADRGAFFDRVRGTLSALPGINVTLGQPISHRIDHMLSGTRANIAVKVFGDDLGELRRLSQSISAELTTLPELSDVAPEPQIEVPEVKISPRRTQLAAHGLTASDLAHFVEAGLGGEEVGEAFIGTRQRHPIVVRVKEDDRTHLHRIGDIPMALPGGGFVPLSEVATIESGGTSFTVSRENVERKAVIAVNMAEGVDLGAAVEAIRSALDSKVSLPDGYRVELGGQFESVQKSNRLLLLTAILATLVIFLLLLLEFKHWQLAGVVLLNLPLAVIGGVVAVALTDGIVSIASIIGLISLFGIATRNGILLVSRYEDLGRTDAGMAMSERIVRGAGDRLNAIVMTALSTALALIPLALNSGVSGNEIQSPMAVVILGGLLSATLLNLYVIPAVYGLVRTDGRT